MDLNHRPSGYEPNELPDCSTPHFLIVYNKCFIYNTLIIIIVVYKLNLKANNK